jgi:ABC-type transport auxiliary lipoprotein component
MEKLQPFPKTFGRNPRKPSRTFDHIDAIDGAKITISPRRWRVSTQRYNVTRCRQRESIKSQSLIRKISTRGYLRESPKGVHRNHQDPPVRSDPGDQFLRTQAKRPTKHRTMLPVLMLFFGMLSGCGAARPSKFYQLTVPIDSTSNVNPAQHPITLLLGPIVSSHLYRDDRIIYTSTGQAMGAYEYHRWVEPPPEMINEALLR